MKRKGFFLVFGAEGSGKSTHARLLAEFLNLPYLSSGELLRKEARGKSEVGRLFQNKKGAYVSDEIIIPFILNTLNHKKYFEGVVLEGFPRNLNQLKALEDSLEKKNLEILKAIYVTLPEDLAVKRLLSRGRADDTPEKIKARLEVYKQHSQDVLEFLREKKVLIEVSNIEPIEVVQSKIRDLVTNDKT